MRRLSILAAAVAACLLFTACPNKPTDEPVVIPDGIYEETAHMIFHRYEYDRFQDTTYPEWLVKDTIYKASLIVSGGDFIYPDMCADTFHYDFGALGKYIGYRSHFVYWASHYCPEGIVPARVAQDGYVVIQNPQFFPDFPYYHGDTSYVYRARVSENEGVYTFRQKHLFSGSNDGYIFSGSYDISHTLVPAQ